MDFDYLAAVEKIRALLRADESVSEKMAILIDACEAQYPHRGWAGLRRLPYDAEASRLAAWVPQLFHGEPPDIPLAGLWFGLFNPMLADGSASADFHFAGSAEFDPDDDTFDWASRADYLPANGDANSEVLANLYAAAYASEDPLGNVAEYPLALGYTAFVIADVFKVVASSLGSLTAVVAVGFDSGDGLLVGHLTGARFVT